MIYSVQGNYFDGRSSASQPATLRVHDGLWLEGAWPSKFIAPGTFSVSEPMGNAPRTVRFDDGSYCEIADHVNLKALLDALGHTDTLSVRLHRHWPTVIGSVIGLFALVAVCYLWLLPIGAKWLAPQLPQSISEHISKATLEALDGQILKPTALAPGRQAEVSQKMAAFAQGNNLPSYRLYFRAAPKDMPPNAFALPNGDIVIFDSLLARLNNDEAIAVFGHELGHVAHHHGLRMLMQSTVVSMAAAVWLGDISSVVATLATATLEANYSQEFESEADLYSALALKHAGRSPLSLVTALQKLTAPEKEKAGDKKLVSAPVKDAAQEGLLARLFSSHPSTSKRIADLNRLAN